MRLVLLHLLFYGAVVLASPSVVDSYAAQQSPIAKAGVLANIGPSGSKSAGAKVPVREKFCHIPYTESSLTNRLV